MLATLRFWPLLGLSLIYAATINVIPASDTSLVYSPGWSLEFSQSTQDSFMQAASVGCYLSVTLPSNASSVSYLGFKRAGGSMYGYTLDCEDDCLLQTANGSDPTVTDETNVPQSTLFTLDLDPTTQHTLYVYNIPSDASDGSSQINLNNLNVALADVTVTQGAGGGLPVPSPSGIGNTGSTSSTTSSASSSSTPEQESSSTTPTSPPSSTSATSSSATATSSSSNGVSVTPTNVGASSGSVTQTSTGTESSASSASSTNVSAVLPVITPSSTAESGNGTGAETAGSSSGSGQTGGLSKSVTIGVSVLAVVFGGAVIAALFVFIRQRRKKHRNSYPGSFISGSQPPLSPTGSIIPIMPPPQMREGSAIYSPAIPNPFIDPPSDLPYNSSLMQRRMEGRTSPGSPASPAPNIPLPDIPRGATDSRSNSPAAAYARSDLWITRSPAKPSFAVL